MTDVHGRIDDLDILPVRCPQCQECQNTLPRGGDPMSAKTEIACMVCGYAFQPMEYRRLLVERQKELQPVQLGEFD